MENFITRQRLISPLSDEAVDALLRDMEEIVLPKGDLCLCEGKRSPYVWFVKTGLVRAYVEREGKDITLWFASDGEMINFVYRDVSAYHGEAVEESVLLRIEWQKLEYLFGKSLELSNWGRCLLDYYLREYENYFINDSWMEACKQYESLLRTQPELIQKVPLKHIASFLQITPQSLSRIRSEVK